jgi:hypothetical protein
MLSGAQPKLFALHAIGDAEISIRIRFSVESPLSMTLVPPRYGVEDVALPGFIATCAATPLKNCGIPQTSTSVLPIFV